MQLVIMAAGFGTRFGGLKQLAPVGPNGEAIMDYTAKTALSCGFDSAVLIVRPEIEDEIRSHVAQIWPSDISVSFAYQPSTPGTAPAVLAARPLVDGPFAVANADDLYGSRAIAAIAHHFDSIGDAEDQRHLLVAYRLRNTVVGDADVKRGLCELSADGKLARIDEHLIVVHDDDTFFGMTLAQFIANNKEIDPELLRPISGDNCVSMNLWGLNKSIFDHLQAALDVHEAGAQREQELLLPEVIKDLIAVEKISLDVVVTEDRCIGITHFDDLAIVREQLLANENDEDALGLV